MALFKRNKKQNETDETGTDSALTGKSELQLARLIKQRFEELARRVEQLEQHSAVDSSQGGASLSLQMTMDEELYIKTVSKDWVRILGYSKNDLKQLTLFDISTRKIENIDAIQQLLNNQRVKVNDFEIKAKDGRVFTFKAIMTPAPQGEAAYKAKFIQEASQPQSEEESARFREAVQQLQSQLSDAESEMKWHKDTGERIQEELRKIREEHQNQLELQQQEIQNLRAQLEEHANERHVSETPSDLPESASHADQEQRSREQIQSLREELDKMAEAYQSVQKDNQQFQSQIDEAVRWRDKYDRLARSLRKKLEFREEQYAELTEEKQNLDEQLTQLQKSLTESQEVQNQLKRQLESQQEAYAQARKNEDHLRQALRDMEHSHQAHESQEAEKQSRQEELQARVDKLVAQKQQLESQLEALRTEKQQAERALDQASTQQSTYQQEIKRLEEALKSSGEALEQAQKEHMRQEQTLDEYRHWKDRYEELEAQLQEAGNREAALEKTLQEKQEALEVLQQEQTQWQQNASRLEAQGQHLKNLAQELQERQSEVERLENELQTCREEHQQRQRDIDTLLAPLLEASSNGHPYALAATEAASATGWMEQLRTRVESHRQSLAKTHQQAAYYKDQFDQAEQQLADVHQQMEALQAEKVAADERIQHWQNQYEKLEAERNQLHQHNERLKLSEGHLREVADQLKDEKSHQQKRMEQLEGQLREEQSKREELLTQKLRAESDLQGRQMALKQSEEELERVRRLLEQQSQEYKSLQEAHKQLQQHEAAQQAHLQQESEQMEQLRRQVQQLEDRLATADRKNEELAQENRRLEKDYQQVQQQHQQLQDQEQQWRRQLDEVRQEYEESQRAQQQLRSQVDAKTNALQQIEQQLYQMQQQATTPPRPQAAPAEVHDEDSAWEEQARQMRQERNRLKQELQTLRDQYEEKEQEYETASHKLESLEHKYRDLQSKLQQSQNQLRQLQNQLEEKEFEQQEQEQKMQRLDDRNQKIQKAYDQQQRERDELETELEEQKDALRKQSQEYRRLQQEHQKETERLREELENSAQQDELDALKETLRERERKLQELQQKHQKEQQQYDQKIRHIRESLQSKTQELEKTVSSAPVGICITNEEGVFESVNTAYTQIYGYTEEELAGQPFTKVVPPGSEPTWQRKHDRFIEHGDEVRGEFEVMAKNGKRLTILADSALIVDQDNQRRKVTFVTDITERKRTEKELAANREQLRSIFDRSPIGICITNQEGHFEQVNEAYTQLYGYDESQLINQPFTMVVPEEEAEWWRNKHDQFLEGLDETRGEFRVVNSKQEYMYILADSARITGDDGKPRKVTFVSDITQRKRTEERLKQSQQQLSATFRHAPIGMCVVNSQGIIESVNPAFARLYQYEETELSGKRIDLIFPNRDYQSGENELELQDKFGRTISVWHSSAEAKGQDGRPVHIYFDMDITDSRRSATNLKMAAEKLSTANEELYDNLRARKRDLKRLKASEESLKSLIEGAPIGMCTVQSDGTIETVNDSFLLIYRLKYKNTVGRSFDEVAQIEVHENQTNQEFRVKDSEGNPRIVMAAMRRFKGTDEQERRAYFLVDITERKRGEQNLELAYEKLTRANEDMYDTLRQSRRQAKELEKKEAELKKANEELSKYNQETFEQLQQALEETKTNEQRLNEAQRLGQIGNFELDMSTGMFDFSEELHRIHGFDPETKGKVDQEEMRYKWIHEDDREKHIRELEECIQKGETYQNTIRIYRPDGGIRYIFVRKIPVYDDEGNVNMLRGVVQDVTEFREQEEQLKSAFNELKSTQNKLVISEKMAALGQLIAGVAHEVNTPISAIKASVRNMSRTLPQTLQEYPDLVNKISDEEAQLLKELLHHVLQAEGSLSTREERKVRKQITALLESANIDQAEDIASNLVEVKVVDEVEKYIPIFKSDHAMDIVKVAYQLGQLNVNLKNIDLASDKTGKVVQALKSYSHVQSSDEMIDTDLVESIRTILTLYNNQLKYGIEIEEDFQEDVPRVPAFQDEIGQVWGNIIINAVQAMDNSGKIKLSLRREGQEAVVQISDNGPGIPEEIRERIFDPFFTTKPQGEGSGLGLDIVKKIVEKHYGTIDLDTETGKGTTFTVRLPLEKPQDEV